MASPYLSQRIVIVGAGVSGLVTAKVLLQDGFTDVTLLESYAHLGGVWAKGRGYPRLSTNSVRGNYSLSDALLYRSPEEWKAIGGKDGGYWVYGDEIREGLEKYADEWHVRERIKFNCQVLDISEVPETAPRYKWNVLYRDASLGAETTVVADLLVVCTGLFSRPNVPRIPGQLPTDENAFKGLQLHSNDVAKEGNVEKLLACKDVAIIGFGKSSLDLCEWLGLERRARRARGVPEAELNRVRLVYRQPHWFVPMQFFAKLDFMRRSGQAGGWWRKVWVPGEPDPDAPPGTLAKKVEKQGRSQSSIEREKMLGRKVTIEEAIRLGHGIPEGHVLVPNHKFAVDSSLGVASEHFYPLALAGDVGLDMVDAIHAIGTDPATGQGYILARPKSRDGTLGPPTRIPCDAIIYGTGFHFHYPFFSPAMQAKLQIPRDNLAGAPRFFRTLLPLAYREGGTILFNGVFNSSSCACNIEVNAHWISEMFLQGGPAAGDRGEGILRVPPAAEMDRQVTAFDALDKIFESGGGAKEGKVHVFGRFIDFADDVLMDMGLKTARNAATREEDWDTVYMARSWGGLLEERRRRRRELAAGRTASL